MRITVPLAIPLSSLVEKCHLSSCPRLYNGRVNMGTHSLLKRWYLYTRLHDATSPSAVNSCHYRVHKIQQLDTILHSMSSYPASLWSLSLLSYVSQVALPFTFSTKILIVFFIHALTTFVVRVQFWKIMESIVLWNAMSCSLIALYRRFGGTWYAHFNDRRTISICQAARHHIPEDSRLILLSCRHGNFMSHIRM
jgi:hypothetical protein